MYFAIYCIGNLFLGGYEITPSKHLLL